MTRVTICRDKRGNFQSFTCEGHAGYAQEGEDVVCAGISAIVINTINCLTDLLGENVQCGYDEEDGYITCVFQNTPQEKASFLIECMIHGLSWIRQQYGKDYLVYEIKEV